MVEVWYNDKSTASFLNKSTSSAPRFDLDIPETRTAHTGLQPIRIYQMNYFLAGNGASRTVSLVIDDTTSSSFTVSAGSEGASIGFKGIDKFYTDTAKQNIRTGFNTSGAIYYGVATDATTDVVRSSDNSILVADSCLYGRFRYQQVPTAPRAYTAGSAVTNITAVGFDLLWLSPTDTGDAPITGYQIQVSTASNFATVTTFDVGETTSATLTGLTPGTTYYYRIAAKNVLSTYSGNPMSVWYTAASTVTTLAASGGKRYNGTTWVDTTVGKRYTGTTWVDLTVQKRYNGSTWVDLT